MGLSAGCLGRGYRHPRPNSWAGTLFGGGITTLAFAAYAALAGVDLDSARTVGSGAVAITLAFAAHYLVARVRAKQHAHA